MAPIPGFIIDLEEPRNFIRFSSFDPPGNQVEPNYEYQTVRGRSTPHRFYGDTGPETWSFGIKLHASLEEGDTRTHLDVWNEHLFIKSFAFPDYGPGRRGPTRPPRLIAIKWGAVMDLEGVLRSPTFQWVLPYDQEGYPFGIDSNFTLEIDHPDAPLDYFDIRAGL